MTRSVQRTVSGSPATAIFGLSVLAAVVFTVLLYVFFLDFVHRLRSPDYLFFYAPVGRNLIEGHGLVTAAGEVAIQYPPGHSVFLAVLFGVADTLRVSSEAMVSVVAIALHAVTATLLFHMTARVFGTKLAVIPALLWATYLPALWLPIAMGSEVTFVPVLVVATLLGWRSVGSTGRSTGLAFLSGIGVGVATLIRPIAVGVGLALCLFLIVARRRRGAAGAGTLAAVLLAGNLTVVLPWELWIYRQTGEVHVISSGGLSSIMDGLTYARPRSEWLDVSLPPDVRVLMTDLRRDYEAGDIESVGRLAGWMISKVTARPLAVMKLIGMKVVRAWYATDSHRYEGFLLALQLCYISLAVGGAVLAWRRGGLAQEMVLLTGLLVAYFWFMSVVALSIMRYMVPVMPFVFALTPPTVVVLWTGLQRRSHHSNAC